MNTGLRERIAEALNGHDARYIEIRIDESDSTAIRYRGRDLEEVNRTSVEPVAASAHWPEGNGVSYPLTI